MSSKIATFATLLGLAIASAGILRMLNVSGLATGNPDPMSVGLWLLVFLFGFFMFGWGLGKRTGP